MSKNDGARQGPKAPSVAQLEDLFWAKGLDLLVDGRKLFLGAEFLPVLEEAGLIEDLPRGRRLLRLEREIFRLQPYDENVDGHRLTWEGRAPAKGKAAPAAAPVEPEVGSEPVDEFDDEDEADLPEDYEGEVVDD